MPNDTTICRHAPSESVVSRQFGRRVSDHLLDRTFVIFNVTTHFSRVARRRTAGRRHNEMDLSYLPTRAAASSGSSPVRPPAWAVRRRPSRSQGSAATSTSFTGVNVMRLGRRRSRNVSIINPGLTFGLNGAVRQSGRRDGAATWR